MQKYGTTNNVDAAITEDKVISAVNLTKVFGKRTCVDQLNINVAKGEVYALLGDNGAGKTTTINMLTTLLAPTSGQFFICGFDGLKQAEKIKSKFGVVSQDIAIYQELTARENLAFVAELYGIDKNESRRRINDLLEKSQLLERADDKVGEFSVGMRQKLSIACAILHEPAVLFMDEPTAELDPASRRQIWSTLKELRANGVTILLTTHYLEEAELLADRIGIIRKGKLVVEGTISELGEKIKAIVTISIQLTNEIDSYALVEKLAKLESQMHAAISHDKLRNVIVITPPKDVNISRYLRLALTWLEQENISFSKFATTKPSLENIFLTITGNKNPISQFDEQILMN